MYFLIGTDEAGYGPFLGPLAVSATLWEVDVSLAPEGIYDALAPVVGVSPRDAAVAVADSKKLYKTSVYKSLSGIAAIEKTVLAMMEIARQDAVFPDTAEELFTRLGDDVSRHERKQLPWCVAELSLPLACSREEITAAASAVSQKMQDAGVRLCDVHSDLVFPARFNRESEKSGSKGVLLLETTLELAAGFYEKIRRENAGADVIICCDKLGGRNFYFAPLMEFFPGAMFIPTVESRDVSEYVSHGSVGTLTVRFQAKGETNIAVALASLFSKYQRELAMIGFNRWWQARVPGLAPTEGYPLDARRFLEAIKKIAETLNISRDLFWRER